MGDGNRRRRAAAAPPQYRAGRGGHAFGIPALQVAAVVLLALAGGGGHALGIPALQGEVIGKSLTPLDGRKAGLRECTLGDLVADGVRAAAKADLALIHAGELREVVIPAGDLEEETLRGALLFPDEQIALVELKADKIRAALERGLSALPQPSAAFLQISGLAVTFRADKPVGQRVESVTAGGGAGGTPALPGAAAGGSQPGKVAPLEGDKVYKVAMPVSLAKGTLGYFRVFNEGEAGGTPALPGGGLKMKQTGVSLGQAVGDYVRASKPRGDAPAAPRRNISITAGQRLRDVSPPRH